MLYLHLWKCCMSGKKILPTCAACERQLLKLLARLACRLPRKKIVASSYFLDLITHTQVHTGDKTLKNIPMIVIGALDSKIQRYQIRGTGVVDASGMLHD